MITTSRRSNRSLVCTAGALAAAVFGGAASTAAAATTLTPLGFLPGGGSGFRLSVARGVSADGSIVAGASESGSSIEAFRWTASSGMVGLGFGSAFGVSGDGSTIVGSHGEAVRWTSGGGVVGLGDLPGGNFESQAYAVNGDGSVIVGQGQSAAGYEAFRWTSAGGMVGLGFLPGGGGSSAAGVSSNGSVVAGTAWDFSSNPYRAFRWTSGTGMQSLGSLPGGSLSQAFGVSSDGSTIVGHSTSSSAHLGVAFRWSSGSGMVALGDLPGGVTQSFAQAVSGDGSVIVGWGSTLAGTEAFIWTPAGGMKRLWDALLASGVDPAADGWTSLSEGLGLSLDGNTIVGYGERNGVGEAFVAKLEPPASTHAWASTAASGDWATPGNWNPPAAPASNWIAQLVNVQPSLPQAVHVNSSSTVRSIVVAGQSQQMTLIVQSGATLTATNDVQVGSLGRVDLAGGTLATPVVNVAAGGALGGRGTVQGNVTSAGTVSPGDPASPLNIGDDYTQQAAGQLVIDLAGTGAGDRLNVAGVATLDGALRVRLVGGFVAYPGLSYTVMTFDSRGGDLSIVNDTGLAGLGFTKTFTSTALALTTTGTGGDANLDGVVNLADFNVLAAHFGTSGQSWLQADFTGDGVVNLSDFNILAGNFGLSAPSREPTAQDWAALAAVVPEPAAAASFAGALIAISRRRKRRRCHSLAPATSGGDLIATARSTVTTRPRLVPALAAAAGLAALAISAPAARAGGYMAVDLYPMPVPAGFEDISNSAAAGQAVQTIHDPSAPSPSPTHAVLWKPDGSSVSLHPDGFTRSYANGTDGIHQFGMVHSDGPGGTQLRTPVVWNGSAAAADLLPLGGFNEAEVQGSGGGRFVGIGNLPASQVNHALLWNSLSAGPIDLHPTNLSGLTHSSAHGAGATQQVGSGRFTTGADHALLWSGSADSTVDLNPANITDSIAFATDGHQQVGNGERLTDPSPHPAHAMLWSGSAESAMDLHPPGSEYSSSYAYAVRNGIQVGVGLPIFGIADALLWRGTADSVVNLHSLLPDGFTVSQATAIDDAGHVFGVAFNIAEQQWHAIVWIPVPEPASLGLLLPLGLAALLRRRRGPGRPVNL